MATGGIATKNFKLQIEYFSPLDYNRKIMVCKTGQKMTFDLKLSMNLSIGDFQVRILNFSHFQGSPDLPVSANVLSGL